MAKTDNEDQRNTFKEYFNSTTAIGRTIYMMKLHFIEKPIEGDVRTPVGL